MSLVKTQRAGFNPDAIKIIIGLGNPGKEYKNTYHSAGILFIDFFKKLIKRNNTNFKMLVSDEYMNSSGKFVKKSISYYETKPDELLLVHDDSDLFLGSYKLDFDRGAAGHKGVASVIKLLRTQKFFRLRIGIRPIEKSETSRKKAEEFVLKTISTNDQKILERAFKEIIEKVLKL